METEIERLRKKVENFPSASSYNRLAELARMAGDHAEAERACRRCIKEFPRNGQAYLILAEMALAGSKRDEAVQLVGTAIEKDPRSYTAHKMMADFLIQDGNLPQALAHLRQILTFKPGDPVITQRVAELDKNAPPGQPKTQTITKPAGTGPAKPSAPGPAPASGNSPPQAAPTPAPGSGSRPAVSPIVGAVPVIKRPPRGPVLDPLCAEAGVVGALVADASGRAVLAKNLKPEQEEILAALAAELGKAGQSALAAIGQSKTATVVLSAANGQVLRFARDQGMAVVILANPGIRPAMLELRARQALIDLGAG
ncbi:hypothetical protein LBMAG53_21500 [Planctomycetota bacterium]|nr:hypothetical protein LBMAG53_21500 [Planctomycetota bacterium]